MLAVVAHSVIFVPVAGFVLAAGTGMLIRARRARADKDVRDGFSITK
jgi:hypothetical protein